MSRNPLLVVAIVGVAFLGIIAGVLVYRQMTLAAIRQDIKEALPGFNPPANEEEAAKGSVEFYERLIREGGEEARKKLEESRKTLAEMRASGNHSKEELAQMETENLEAEKELNSTMAELEQGLKKAKAEYEAVKKKGR